MVDYFIGTMGFSYKEWAGTFYPTGLRSADYLTYYSQIFNAVEIDSTFYGVPKISSVTRWREQSPEDFKICLKVPRSITHESGLVNVGRELDSFFQAIAPLHETLGVILIQFPPSFDTAHAKVFTDFLEQLPKNQTFAVEFRHSSWYIPQTTDLLSKYSICWAASEFPGVPREVDLTTDFVFIRLVGQHGRFAAHNQEQIDVVPQLEKWWTWIQSKADQVHSMYVFFNDDYSGHAPASANRLKEIMGLPVIKPDIPQQMSFF